MEIKTVVVKAHVRYWNDTKVNVVEETENGSNVQFKQGELWCPRIHLETGIIENWEIGKTAFIHFKATGGCGWDLLDAEGLLNLKMMIMCLIAYALLNVAMVITSL